ncbi:MAG: DUF1150 family protein [Rhodospirillales bacterium]|nr:DUF1150 family protein [Rhodospirillales bacterium]
MNTNASKSDFPSRETQFRTITVADLEALGADQMAYVKPVTIDGENAYVIHSADGQELASVPARDVAEAAIRQHDMVPVSVH